MLFVWTVALGSAIVAWLDSASLGTAATGIVIIFTALGTGFGIFYERVSSARAKAKKEWDAVNAGSLSEKLDHIQRRLEDANQKLHSEKNESNARVLIYQGQIEHLTDQLKISNQQLHLTNELLLNTTRQLELARDELKKVGVKVQDNTDRLEQAAHKLDSDHA